jgi:hypothetical protein
MPSHPRSEKHLKCFVEEWKDVMVGFVSDAPPDLTAGFEGFADLMGGKFRPS